MFAEEPTDGLVGAVGGATPDGMDEGQDDQVPSEVL